MEACGIWHGLYDYLVQRCKVVKVANPLQTKLNLSGKKTDKLDSMRLADLLRMNRIIELLDLTEDEVPIHVIGFGYPI